MHLNWIMFKFSITIKKVDRKIINIKEIGLITKGYTFYGKYLNNLSNSSNNFDLYYQQFTNKIDLRNLDLN